MAKSPSPFAGMKLTNQTPLAETGVDQKLFARPAPLLEKPVSQIGQEKEEAAKPPTPTLMKPQKRVAIESVAAEAKGFDLNHPTQKSETFAFTFEELLALTDLKTGLTRLLGMDARVTKIDIIRSALHMIVDDYRKHGEQSFIVARMKTKKPVDRIRTKKSRSV
jgi:hypothetical protein